MSRKVVFKGMLFLKEIVLEYSFRALSGYCAPGNRILLVRNAAVHLKMGFENEGVLSKKKFSKIHTHKKKILIGLPFFFFFFFFMSDHI